MGVRSLISAGAILPALFSASFGCGGDPGEEESQILMPYEQLSGGMVFATSAVIGSDGYDLYWATVPQFPTLERQVTIKLTEAAGNEWQPSVSASGKAIVFSRQDKGIFLITESGRVKRVSDTEGTQFKDSLPSVSFDGLRVAWTREDYARPIGDTGFVETSIMMANFDGSDLRALAPKTNVIQDASKFEPLDGSAQIAWSEFNAGTLTASGPRDYGIWVHDFQNGTGSLKFPGELVIGNEVYRCFGQHLTWPIPEAIVLPQTFLELHFATPRQGSSVLGNLINSLTTQQLGMPVLENFPGALSGFFRPFPLSASYQGVQRMVFDGLISSIEGDFETLAFYVSDVDGTGVWRLSLLDLTSDFDPLNTAGYLFSVATPQLIP